MTDATRYWDDVYSTRQITDVSWFQREPTVSLRLIVAHSTIDDSVVDVGAGESFLVDRLLGLGYSNLTLLDASGVALDEVARRVGPVVGLQMVVGDVLEWVPLRRYDLWHDRAVFHFLTDGHSRERYVEVAADALAPGGTLILGVFAEDGPPQCSGLDVSRYSPARLESVFADTFSMESHEREEHVTPSGGRQSFTWVTLRRRGS